MQSVEKELVLIVRAKNRLRKKVGRIIQNRENWNGEIGVKRDVCGPENLQLSLGERSRLTSSHAFHTSLHPPACLIPSSLLCSLSQSAPTEGTPKEVYYSHPPLVCVCVHLLQVLLSKRV